MCETLLRQSWELAEELDKEMSQLLEEKPIEHTSNAIRNILLDTYHSDVTFREEMAIKCCSHLLARVLSKEITIITEEDINKAVQESVNRPTEEEKLLINHDIVPWLQRVGFQKVDRDYCKNQSITSSNIYVPPISPNLGAILAYLGNPRAVSSTTISNIVSKSFSQPYRKENIDRQHLLEITHEDLEIFEALVKQQLEQEGWTRIRDSSGDIKVWINMGAVEDAVTSNGSVLPESDINELLIKSILLDLPEINRSTTLIVDGYIQEMKRHLKKENGWRMLITPEHTWWHSSHDVHKAELLQEAVKHQKTLENIGSAGESELREAIHFLENNRESLVEYLSTSPEAIEHNIKRMEGELEFRILCESSETIEHQEKSTSTFDTTGGPTLYDISRQFEEAIKKNIQEEDDDEGDVYKP